MHWWQAVREGDPRVLSRVEPFIHLRDARGLSNLHVACEAGHPGLVSAFLRAGLDATDTCPMPPLIYAAHAGRCDIVRILLSAGAKIPVAWNLNTVPHAPQNMLRASRTVRKWRRWTQRRRQSRERQWAHIVWYVKRISCDKQWLLGFL